jgi:hypothetical protein
MYGGSIPSTGNVFVDHWLRIHIYVLETSGASTFTSAQWFQFVIASLIGTQQQSNSFLVLIPALLGAFLRSKDLFGCSL